jgi:hypothetical protein
VVTGKGWKLAFKHVLNSADESVNRLYVDGLRRVDPSDAGEPFIEFVGEVMMARGWNKHQPMRVNETSILWVLNNPKESGWGNEFSEAPRWALNPFPEFGANLRKDLARFSSGDGCFPKSDGYKDIWFKAETSCDSTCMK